MGDTASTLLQVPLFSDLRPSELARVARLFREDHFARDETIFYEGDQAQRFWVVREGQVKIVKYGQDGREIVIEVIPPGEVFGGATMLLRRNPATAKALSDASTLSLEVTEYERLIREYPDIAVRIIRALGDRLLGVIGVRVLASQRVERRIAHILLKLASKCGRDVPEGCCIELSLTRQDIADLADTSLETAIRVMSRFRKQGWVRTLRGGYVVLLDRQALAQLSQVGD